MGTASPSGVSRQRSSKRPRRVIPFGKYLLLERLAVGGMAEVYLAKSFGVEGFEKVIAIKRILPTMVEDADFIEMFIDEAKIAGQLSHANICPIYELGRIGESHYIAMEYVWGKDLLQTMNRCRRMRRHMPVAMVAWIAARMCEALQYAHSKRDRKGRPLKIIHRDVSPQNIIVSYDGAVKLIDFGIARASSKTNKTRAGVLKGKFGYMSPEQVRGLPIDHRSDLFAVGTCLYEMLTTERLFLGESDFSTLEKVRNAAVAPLSRTAPHVPEELANIVMKSLSRDADDRYSTAAEMQGALQEFLAKAHPGFATTKLSSWLKSAFSEELAKEKERIDSFAKVGKPQPARKRTITDEDTAPVTDPSVTEEPTRIHATGQHEVTADETTVTPYSLESEDPDQAVISDQPTQIFFSSGPEDEPETPPADEPRKRAPTAGLGSPTMPPEGPQAALEAHPALPPATAAPATPETPREAVPPALAASQSGAFATGAAPTPAPSEAVTPGSRGSHAGHANRPALGQRTPHPRGPATGSHHGSMDRWGGGRAPPRHSPQRCPANEPTGGHAVDRQIATRGRTRARRGSPARQHAAPPLRPRGRPRLHHHGEGRQASCGQAPLRKSTWPGGYSGPRARTER